ncbi:MAG: MarR family winged helix-turn-helix transcriptional regulator [Acutalibacteraceae bacterium]|jgi:DNA-binding MarR family transcriptional regulator
MNRFERFSSTVFNICRYWNKIAAEEMNKHDLKAAYALYLVTMLNHGEPITSAKLCELCGRDKADVSRAVATFEKRGLVVRSGDKNYRAILELTPQGKEIAKQLNSRATLALKMAGEGINEEGRENLYTCLDLISNNLKEISEKGLPDGINKADTDN